VNVFPSKIAQSPFHPREDFALAMAMTAKMQKQQILIERHQHFHRQLIEPLIWQRHLRQLHAIQRFGQQFLRIRRAVFARQLRNSVVFGIDLFDDRLNFLVGVPPLGFSFRIM